MILCTPLPQRWKANIASPENTILNIILNIQDEASHKNPSLGAIMLPSLKLTASLPLKIDGLKMTFPFAARPIFRSTPLVSGRVQRWNFKLLSNLKLALTRQGHHVQHEVIHRYHPGHNMAIVGEFQGGRKLAKKIASRHIISRIVRGFV